jgi:SAM-dependent methyltransferase
MASAYPYRFIPGFTPLVRWARSVVSSIRFAGDRFECPVCEGRVSQRIGGELGECPICRAGSRQRVLWTVLNREWSEENRVRDVLHFAPEWGSRKRLRRDPNVGRYVTADLASPEADVHTDITALIFQDESFDVIICSHVLEHIPDDKQAIAELYRVLRPGGIAYVQVPFASDRETDEDPMVTDPLVRQARFGQFDHVRLYGIDFSERLVAAGFCVEELRPARGMTGEEMLQLGLWDDILFRCQRPASVKGSESISLWI